MKKIILFEINEVPTKVWDYYCRLRPESTINKIKNASVFVNTFAEDDGVLSPWITWPTLHRGVSNEKHLISDFGQDLSEVNQEFPPIWDLLARNKIDVGLFGSLHSYPLPEHLENYKFYVPDPFAPSSETFPQELTAFQEFNLKMSRESGRNVNASLPVSDGLKLISKIPSLGIRMETLWDLFKQVTSEKISKWKTVRRRTYQSILSFDLFYKQLVEKKPAFSTFFTNHVASSMHRYWAALFKNDYNEFNFDEEWVRTFDNEIIFTMDKFDNMLRRLKYFVDENPDFCIWVVSSMGQAATEAKPFETQLYLTNKIKFLSELGIPTDRWTEKPAMLPRFNFMIDESLADEFEEKLKSFTINEKDVIYTRHEHGFFMIKFGQENLYDSNIELRIGDKSYTMDELGLENIEIQDKSGTNAYHIPNGIFFMYNFGNSNNERTEISTTDIAPMILSNYNIKKPEYMRTSGKLVNSMK